MVSMRSIELSRQTFLVFFSMLLLSCGSDDVQETPVIPGDVDDTNEETDLSSDGAEEENEPVSCPVLEKPENRDRFVVVSKPYRPGAERAPDYEVWTLSQNEDIAPTETLFSMSRTFKGEIAFRVDGSIGAVAQDDGSLGVFKIDDQGNVDVTHSSYVGEFEANSVSFDPNHPDRLIVMDGRWDEFGGGLYEVMLDCEGTIVSESLIVTSKLATDMTWMDREHLLLSATSALDSGEPHDLHVLDWQPQNVSRRSSSFNFDGELVKKSFVAFTSNKKHLLVAENSGLTSRPHRIAVYEWTEGTMLFKQLIESIEDPHDALISPFDDSALVISGFGDSIYRLEYDENSETPFGPPTTVSSPPLPGHGVMIKDGLSEGLVLVAENVGIRMLKFNEGSVIDLGAVTRSGIEHIIGAIGVQP